MCSVCSEAKECIRSCGPCCHLTDVSVSDPERDRQSQTDRQTQRGQEHEGCFIGMFLDSICLLNSGL